MLHIITSGIDRAVLIRALSLYLQSWGQSPAVIDFDEIATNDYEEMDSFLTLPCCIVAISNPRDIIEWLQETKTNFCWYEYVPPDNSELWKVGNRHKEVKLLGGKLLLLLSERLFQRKTKPTYIFIPVIEELSSIDWLAYIGDRASNPFLRDRLFKALYPVFGDLVACEIVPSD
jgi:hypothetical protein